MTTPVVDRTGAGGSPTSPAPAPPPPPPPPPFSADFETAAVPNSAENARAALLTAAAGGTAAAAAAWMVAGVFPGVAPRLLGVGAAAIGAGAVAVSAKVRQSSAAQLIGVGAIAVFAALAGLIGRPAGSSLPQLVVDALRGGGLADAPVAFDPGWRVVLVAVSGLLGLGAAGLAASLRRPRLAIAVAAPVLAAGTLVQPPGAEVVSASVALALLIAAFGVGAAVDLVRDGASSGRFELGRAARGAGLLVVLVAVLVVAGRFGALLPSPKDDVVVPPQRPRPSPPLGDRELFEVTSAKSMPWRLGTLDVYDGTAWLTPPFDPARFEDPAPNGTIPTPSVKSPESTVTATFEVRELAGRALPALANPVKITPGESIQVDPRTQVVRLRPGVSAGGRRYTVVAATPPTGAQLAEAPPAEADGPMAEFLKVPAPPAEVADLLEALPDVDDFNRLQAARQAYYAEVVAAGTGNPVDVAPSRVAELLAGQEGTPYEITAGEAILARWVGVPARIGYGWFGGDQPEAADPFSIRPKHGATWLEVWFDGHGWVPLVGRPPKAKASLSKDTKSTDPSIRPSDRLTVFTYVPVRLEGLRQSAVVVRYWTARVVPVVGLVLLGYLLAPAVAKARRRRTRRKWASGSEPNSRIASAYADVRDLLTDLGVSRSAPTPLQTLAVVDGDEEHEQLAWLVTRGLWGDLARDLTAEDAEAAEALAVSVRRRLLRAQPWGARIAAALSKSSLRDPWGADLPGGLVGGGVPASDEAASAAAVGVGARRRLPGRRTVVIGAVALSVLVAAAGTAITLAGRSASNDNDRPDPSQAAISPLREPVVPDTLLGDVVVRRELGAENAFRTTGSSSLVSGARVFSLTVGPSVEGSLQAAALREDVASRGDEVVADVLRSLGGGGFQPARFGGERGFSLQLPEQRLTIWFTPDRRGYVLLVSRAAFERADEAFAAVLAAQRGRPAGSVDIPVPDPRRVLP